MRDPLSFFLHEKVASDDDDQERHIFAPGRPPRLESRDPGERALAGLASVGGTVASAAIPWIVQRGLELMHGGQVPWHNAIDVQDATSVADALSEGRPRKGKLLGLFNLSPRTPGVRGPSDIAAVEAAGSKLQEIQEVADSFINKHQLAEKGVRLNFNKSVLSSGNSYHIPTKRLHFSQVDKESVLHELGHAADFTGSRLGKLRGAIGPALNKGVAIALPIALAAGDRIKEIMPGTIDDKAIGFMQDHAPEIMGATLAATTLYPEAKASYLAIKHIAKTEGPEAAKAAFKKLAPNWATYLVGAIPAVVGMALARKYMRQARAENEDDVTKTAGVLRDIAGDLGFSLAETGKNIAHLGKQIGHQSVAMIKEPGTTRKILSAAKEVGTSPEFITGALSAAVPAAMSSLYLYGTQGGKEIRGRVHPGSAHELIDEGRKLRVAGSTEESWRERHPVRFAGLVAAGAALSAGVLSKFFSDLQRVI